MPTTAFFIKALSVVLQYGILILLFYFIYLVVKFMREDSRPAVAAARPRETHQQEAVLTVTEAGDASLQGRRFAFSEELSIGRGEENDIVINDTYVSHHHAVISLVNNQYVIEDLKSVNHTYVNDQILSGRAYLQTGDIIRIGMATFRFER